MGFLVKFQGENLSSGYGVLKETPRIFVLLFVFLVLEETKFDGNSGNSGDQMKVPSVIAGTAK